MYGEVATLAHSCSQVLRRTLYQLYVLCNDNSIAHIASVTSLGLLKTSVPCNQSGCTHYTNFTF